MTDSGSTNNTMTHTMYALINNNAPNQLKNELALDPMTMHIRCMCHKITLIFNAGLSALLLKILPPGKAKESILGFFPVLGSFVKEEELDATLPTEGIQFQKQKKWLAASELGF